MKKEIENFKRKELFQHYHANTNPFSFVTTKVDITNLYQFCKKKRNFYATIGYYVALTMNQIDEFRCRYEDGKFYQYDRINPSFTQKFDDNTIGFFTCEMKDNYDEFIEEFLSVQEKFFQNHKSYSGSDAGEVWLSCEPWFHSTSLVVPFNKENTIPQVIWDKFSLEGDKCYINMMIMVHHGFADGYHIGKFINTFTEFVSNIEV